MTAASKVYEYVYLVMQSGQNFPRHQNGYVIAENLQEATAKVARLYAPEFGIGWEQYVSIREFGDAMRLQTVGL